MCFLTVHASVRRFILLGSLASLVVSTPASAKDMAPFVIPWDDVAPGPMDLSGLNDANLTRIAIGNDGHFYRNGERYRLWGINFGWSACFLTHHEADVLAARIAKFGVNAVRLHGCDEFWNYKVGSSLIDYSKGTSRTLQAAGLDSFDYFVSQLQRHGIYVDINLYVGRRFLPGDGTSAQPLPVPEITAGEMFNEDSGQWHKHLGFFYDPIRELHKEYASQLLTHANPYTGKSYATDPGVAFVEVLNEGGLLHYWLWGRLDEYPDAILLALREKWNQWLSMKAGYASTTALDAAWGTGGAAIEHLANSSLSAPLAPWTLEVTSPAVATIAADATDATHPGARIDVTTPGTEVYSVQLTQGGLSLQLGQTYTISLWARASSDRSFSYAIRKIGDPWTELTPWQQNQPLLTTTWQQYQLPFTVTDPASAGNAARFEIANLGWQTGTVWISAPSVKSGGSALQAGESLEAGTIPNIPRASSRPFTLAAQRDFVAFLRDTEADFYSDMLDHLRTKVGLLAPVSGSQMMSSTPSIQSLLDIIDTHSYWDLPGFPSGTQWDPETWVIQNTSSILSPPGVLELAAAGRVAGKPHIMTETSLFAPNDYNSEGGITLGAYAGLQDMDGVFVFGWANYQSTFQDSHFSFHLDSGYHPGMLTALYLSGLLFRTFDVTATSKTWQVAMDAKTELDTALAKGRSWRVVDITHRGFPVRAALLGRPEMNLATGAQDSTFPDLTGITRFEPDTGELSWDTAARHVLVHSARSRGVVGITDGQRFALGGPKVDCSSAAADCIVFEPGTTRRGFSALSLSLVEGTSFSGNARAILTAVGEVANTGMIWNAARTSVGSSWGGPPTLIEHVPATITLPRPASEVRVFALDGRGQRMEELAVTGDASSAVVKIGAGVPTLWYEVDLGAVATPTGEGDATLTLCAKHCAGVATALPACYPNTTACLARCGYWIDTAAAGACDCSAPQAALLSCIADNGAPALACGGEVLGVSFAGACATKAVAFERCIGNRYPCKDWGTELLGDFEDGSTRIGRAGFGEWFFWHDPDLVTVPDVFTTAAGGVHGSAGRFSLATTRGWDASKQQVLGYAALGTWSSAAVDLSRYAGVGFYARGSGKLRVTFPTKSMAAAKNDDAFGRTITLHPDWTWHSVLFDDPAFRQEGWGSVAAFDRADVEALRFAVSSRSLDVDIDDVTLLLDPDQGCHDGGCGDADSAVAGTGGAGGAIGGGGAGGTLASDARAAGGASGSGGTSGGDASGAIVDAGHPQLGTGGAASPPGSGGASRIDASLASGGQSGNNGNGDGCGCRLAGNPSRSHHMLLLLGWAAALLLRRRR